MQKRKARECNLCKGRKFTHLFKLDIRNFVKCRNCGLILTSPQPTSGQLNKLYKNYFGDVVDPDGKNSGEPTNKTVRKFRQEQFMPFGQRVFPQRFDNVVDTACGSSVQKRVG